MGRKEDRLCGNPPSLDFIIYNDTQLTYDMKTIFDGIIVAYNSVDEYVIQFDRIRLSYQENLAVDHDVIRGETNLEVLRMYCERFTNQMADLEQIQESHPLGLLQVKQVAFREEITPICQQLLAVLDETIPRLAMEKINYVEQKGEELQTKLLIVPEETNHYIYYFNHMEVCHEHVASLQKELNYAYEALKIMKKYHVTFRDEDKDKYLGKPCLNVSVKYSFKTINL